MPTGNDDPALPPSLQPNQGTVPRPPEPASPPSEPDPPPSEPAPPPPPEPALPSEPTLPAPTETAAPTVALTPTQPKPSRLAPIATPRPAPTPTPTSSAQARQRIGSLVYTYTTWLASPGQVGVRICLANWGEQSARAVSASVELLDDNSRVLKFIAPQPWGQVRVEPRFAQATLDELPAGLSASLEAYLQSAVDLPRRIRVDRARLLQPEDPVLPCPAGVERQPAAAPTHLDAEIAQVDVAAFSAWSASPAAQASSENTLGHLSENALLSTLGLSIAGFVAAAFGLYRLRRRKTSGT